jgi:leukotriene-A4 hydrolase
MPDPTTQANYLQISTKHVHFNWSLDFENQIVEGTAIHTLVAQESGVEEVMYITISMRHNLRIVLTVVI